MNAYRRHWFSDPASSFLRPCGFPRSARMDTRSSVQSVALAGFSLRSKSSRAKPSRCAAALHSSSHGLYIPTALQAAKIHCTRAFPARYGPPSGFDYPLGGFRPSLPCRLCFAPAALLGFTLRSVLHSPGNAAFPRALSPHAVCLRIDTPAEARIESRSAAASGF
jgi:hypothetical protein